LKLDQQLKHKKTNKNAVEILPLKLNTTRLI